MGDLPNLEVVARVYKGRKAVGFRLVDIDTGAEYLQPDENVVAFVKAGVVTDLKVYGDRLASGDVKISELPKEDLDTGKPIESSKRTTKPKRKQNKYTIAERHEKIINAFIDDGSISYGLHTCLNMIKLYKIDDMVVKLAEQQEIINGLRVILEDTRNGLYYVFKIIVSDATINTNEIWRASVEMVTPGKVSSKTKLSDVRPLTYNGKPLHKDGYFINDDGKREFVDMRSMAKNDRLLNSKELLELKVQRGNSTKLNEFVMGEVVPIEGHLTQGRIQAILKIAQYMYIFTQLADNINSKMQAM